ncbi:hypothetical protein BGW39_006993 [Mortierella sp. 14UC]|nr:hypothetical protein BGW39_006993 [Mortierella sp. 14UC]
MLPHLNQSRLGAQPRSHHEHYTGSCPLSCPARRTPSHHHYPTSGQPFQPHHPHLDASKLHPAFSGLFFQQRRTYTSAQHPHAPQQPPPHMSFNTPGGVGGVGGMSTVPPPPGVVTGPGDPRMQGAPMLDHFAIAASGAGGVGCGGNGPVTMDPARTSPIFYGYSSKPDKPKM